MEHTIEETLQDGITFMKIMSGFFHYNENIKTRQNLPLFPSKTFSAQSSFIIPSYRAPNSLLNRNR